MGRNVGLDELIQDLEWEEVVASNGHSGRSQGEFFFNFDEDQEIIGTKRKYQPEKNKKHSDDQRLTVRLDVLRKYRRGL